MSSRRKARTPVETDVTILEKGLVVDATLRGHAMRFETTWGLFSPRGVDEGSALLLKYVEVAEDARILDLGCGWGALGLTLAKDAPAGSVMLVDKDFVAVEHTKKNARLNGIEHCEVLLSNGLSQVPPEARFDLVVSNLPAKVGREQLTIFLTRAAERMDAGARIVVVTINGLRKFVKRSFLETFGSYEKLKQGRAYTVGMATR